MSKSMTSAGCHAVFVPTAEEMYPPGATTAVEPPEVAQPLEGVCRPGHFRGVATIVLKLFHLIPADVACFGQKDFQQALVIRRMVADLNVPIDVVVCPTVREPDGLALSSRNVFLAPDERKDALVLLRALTAMRQAATQGERNGDALLAVARGIVAAVPNARLDYVALADVETMKAPQMLVRPTQGLIAVFFGKTRLIDNLEI